jgi:hypothetical protein
VNVIAGIHNFYLLIYNKMKTYKQVKNISGSYAKLMRDNFPDAFSSEITNEILFNLVRNEDKSIFAQAIDSA